MLYAVSISRITKLFDYDKMTFERVMRWKIMKSDGMDSAAAHKQQVLVNGKKGEWFTHIRVQWQETEWHKYSSKFARTRANKACVCVCSSGVSECAYEIMA